LSLFASNPVESCQNGKIDPFLKIAERFDRYTSKDDMTHSDPRTWAINYAKKLLSTDKFPSRNKKSFKGMDD